MAVAVAARREVMSSRRFRRVAIRRGVGAAISACGYSAIKNSSTAGSLLE